MVFTRQEAKAAFQHVLDNVLGKDDSSPLKQAIVAEGFEDVFTMMTMDDTIIDTLVYDKSPTEINVAVSRGEKTLAKGIQAYVRYLIANGNPLSEAVDWMALTQQDFDLFRVKMTPVGTGMTTVGPLNPAGSQATSAGTWNPNTHRYTPADNFHRGIKQDTNLIEVLKEEKFNDTWHRTFYTQARAQDLMEVLDATYVPTTQEEKDLFNEKQKYVYAVLEMKVLTDRGKGFIREHENNYDAQKVYQKILDHHLKSTKAMIDSASILSYITSVRLGNGMWKGTTEAFVIHWENQVRLYERQVSPTDHFSDGIKRTMLENAIHPIDELRQIKNNADLEKTKTGRTLTFSEYTSLLLSACAAYDEAFKPKLAKRQVFANDVSNAFDDGGQYDYDPEESYDIDAPVYEIQANAHNRMAPRSRPNGSRPPRSGQQGSQDQRTRMPFDRWSKLSAEERALWDQLSEAAKTTILGATVTKDTTKRHTNLHEISAYDYLQANIHETTPDSTTDNEIQEQFHEAKEVEESEDSTILVNSATSGKPLTPSDIRRVMSSSSKRYQGGNPTLDARMHVTYVVASHRTADTHSLIDRGSNGGVAGKDVRVISKSHRKVDIRGIDNHQLNNIQIGTVGAYVETNKGPVIAVFHQYALLGTGPTIHSPGQFEHYKNDVNDKSVRVGGLQRIKTLDGYTMPLDIKSGLVRLNIRPYTDQEWDALPHVLMTSEIEWNPSSIDHNVTDDEQWYDAIDDLETDPTVNLFDEYGNYRRRVEVQQVEVDDTIDQCIVSAHQHENVAVEELQPQNAEIPHHDEPESDDEDVLNVSNDPREISKKEPDYALLRPLFGWLSVDIIKSTFSATTQYARLPSGTLLKRSFKSSNPALNVHRRNENVACDFVYADTPAVDDGATSCVLFVGTESLVTDVYGVKTDKQFVNTLEDNIRERGAPNKLISDRAQVEISNKVLDILRILFIGAWQSEPHQQQQNPAERRIQTIKGTSNRIMDRVGAPAYTWLLCILYVCYLLNHTYNDSIKAVPLNRLTGTTVDISPLLRFHFWQKVYYKQAENTFPSESKEGTGHIVGISEHVGPMMTWKVLNMETRKVLYRSQIRPYDPHAPNLRADLLEGENDPIPKIIKSRLDANGEKGVKQNNTPIFSPKDLVGRTFLKDTEDGHRDRVRIVKLIEEFENNVANDPTRIKFVCKSVHDDAEETITYNQMLDYINRDQDDERAWKFKKIVSHQGPLKPSHPDYKGSTYNVMVEHETGETYTEPLSVVAADDPVTCAIYAKGNNLLDVPGWKRFKGLAKREKKLFRMVNQAKLRSFRTAPKYKYGYEVPRDYPHALKLDELNKNTKWYDSIGTELGQIDDYDTFQDIGHKSVAKPPPGYKKIRVHFVFDVKHDGRHKARLVADGHLTDIPLESVYSGVVSLRGFRMVLFLAELNHMETWATDIGNAYLEAETAEKIFIEAGTEFGDRCGHILIVRKALYGLRSSGARWHDKLADCLRELGFFPCKAEPDIWMRRSGEIYEYVAVYVDDLAFALRNPQEFVDILMSKYKFKLKGTGPIAFHLGMDIYRDDDGILCIAPRKYIERMIATYERIFGEAPRQVVTSPLEKGDHPELDTSDLLDDEGIRTYQSLVGALQWSVSIGRIDVTTAVMTMSGFRVAPRHGHLDRLKRIYGYLSKMRNAMIRIRTEEPDYSDLPDMEYDWTRSVYGEVSEVMPTDAPPPLGNHVTLTHYVDANLMHDIITGRSVTGILHLANKTPIDWYSKKQATVETATYGSEFVAARTCVDQVVDLRCTLRYLGVPVRGKSYMFGDNESVVNSSAQVHAKLHKRHNMLSFHRVREAVASRMIGFWHTPGPVNPADILSKHWGYSSVWQQLKAIMFWKGDTADIKDSG